MRMRFGGFLLLALGLSPGLFGQTLGEIVGDVRDTTGGVVTGATISVTNISTNATGLRSNQ